MKAQRIQAEFIRKRDLQHAYRERTNCKLNLIDFIEQVQDKCNIFLLFSSSAVQKYYDNMNRITSLHEHWSTPEYLQESEEKMRKRLEFDERQKLLGDRQLRLRKLLDDETKKLSEEVQGELKVKMFISL